MSGWDESAQAWIADNGDQGDWSRRWVLDPVMRELCAELAGKIVLDLGCGEGRFSRILSELGAHPIGADPTSALVHHARERSPDLAWVRAWGEQIPLQTGSVDAVAAYLVLIDVPDFRACIREMTRVVKPGGKLFVANMNSFATTSPQGWVRDAEGAKTHFPVDRYMEERGEWVEWRGIRILNYHRPLEAYMQAFLGCGLELLDYRQPLPIEGAPNADHYCRVPWFNVMVWRRPQP